MGLDAKDNATLWATYFAQKYGGDAATWQQTVEQHGARIVGRNLDEYAAEALRVREQTFGPIQSARPQRPPQGPGDATLPPTADEPLDDWDRELLNETKRRVEGEQRAQQNGETWRPAGPTTSTLGDAVRMSQRLRKEATEDQRLRRLNERRGSR